MSENPAYILVIEDDKVFCETVVFVLQKEGYEVAGAADAADGIEAQRMARERQFSLIISDVRLPGGIDGIETSRRIKEMNPSVELPVIIMTGYADEVAYQRAKDIGVNDYLNKPFSSEVFLKIVKQSLKMNN